MRSRALAVALLLTAGADLGTNAPVRAQVVFPLQNPSVRSAGMGGSSAAVVWSGDLNTWANPALLGYASGLTVRWTHADLSYLPVRFSAGGIEYGWGGAGLSYGHDGIRLDLTGIADPAGNPPPPGEISERVRRWGGALSVARVIEAVRDAGSSPGILRHADLALGFARKRGDFRYPTSPGGTGETAGATDLGVLVRLSPLPQAPGGGRFLDLTYGYSRLEEPFYRTSDGSIPDHRRHGIGARIGRSRAPSDLAGHERRRFDRFIRGEGPILALTVAADIDRFENQGIFGGRQSRTSRAIGAEVALANALAVRFGHIRDEVQDLDGFSFGAGIGVPIASVARVRYDYARFPGSGLDGGKSGNRHAVSMWLDPIAMVRR